MEAVGDLVTPSTEIVTLDDVSTIRIGSKSLSYWPDRFLTDGDADDLLRQVGEHIHVRLSPDARRLAETMAGPPDKSLVVRLLQELLERLQVDRTGYLALLELRLEATRRPELQAALTRTISENLEQNVRFHLDAGLPGDRTTVVSLYLAMSGLMVERLTLPDVLPEDQLSEVITELVERTLVSGPGGRR